ncbi:hypothetical protein V1460_16450 [Streptomyces sp. SCSIO 30461]|uniref:hypothetical protein n=1 Tax=Streptomyces sp. SCSIO 30461 TaxID=3118085 RepID=UPI0030CA9478
MIDTPEAAPTPCRVLFGQPWGLSTLFLTEIRERFIDYGMRALLVVCLAAPLGNGSLGFPANTAIEVGHH